MDSKKVHLELTPEQRDKIKKETGKTVESLDFEALEDRDAPFAFRGATGMQKDPQA